jgi:hypothetical protein
MQNVMNLAQILLPRFISTKRTEIVKVGIHDRTRWIYFLQIY